MHWRGTAPSSYSRSRKFRLRPSTNVVGRSVHSRHMFGPELVRRSKPRSLPRSPKLECASEFPYGSTPSHQHLEPDKAYCFRSIHIRADNIAGPEKLAMQDDAYCQSIGAAKGTPQYTNCRLTVTQQREDKHNTAWAAAIISEGNNSDGKHAFCWGRVSNHAAIYVPTGLVVMALRNARGELTVEMVCVPSPTP
ncbi:hypothetical protein ABIC08_009141 [Bradyrhizobium sp. RT9b]